MIIPFIDIGSRCTDIKCIETYRMLGYKVACIEQMNQKIMRTEEFTAVRRITLEEASQKRLRDSLKREKNRSYIVSVLPLSVETARLAARDRRVDTVVLAPESIRVIDKTEILMIKRFSKSLEIPINIFLVQPPTMKAMILRRVELALRYNIVVLMSSWAKKWNEILPPISFTALGSIILRMPMKTLLANQISYAKEILVKNGVHIW